MDHQKNRRLKKIYILGGNGFVGRSLFDFLKAREQCFLVTKEQINFLKPETFSNLSFDNSIIIDCVNVNNNKELDIMDCNYRGLLSFTAYLGKTAVSFNYVYISTISVLSDESVKTNVYVRSKKMAEDHLLSSGMDCQIIRLSYPIGSGENKARLISRLIGNLRLNESILIQDVLINLNDIGDVVAAIYDHLLKEPLIFISSNQYISLSEVVYFLKKQLNSESKIEVKKTDAQFTPKAHEPFVPSKNIKDTLFSML